MTEPLVDGEGYPRSDIDVYTIRHIRHEIICKSLLVTLILYKIFKFFFTKCIYYLHRF